jgi:hypothetical protein
MKFEIGDAVALKTTGEEGILISLNARKNIAEVNIKGVVFPVHLDALEHPYLNLFLKKKFTGKEAPKQHIDNIPVEKPAEKNTTIAFENYGVHLLFVPVYNAYNFDLDNVEKVKVYLVNNTPVAFSFSYSFKNNNGVTFTIASEIHTKGNFYLHDIEYENLATGPYFELIGTQQLEVKQDQLLHFSESFQLKPKKLFGYIQEMQQKNTALFGIPILKYEMQGVVRPNNFSQKPIEKLEKNENFIRKFNNRVDSEKTEVAQKIEELKNVANRQSAKQQELKSKNGKEEAIKPKYNLIKHFDNPLVVDLHIEKLAPSETDIPHEVKLTLQIEYFLKALENAIMIKQNSLTVIHGLGKGVLKAEIHGILNQTKEVHSYVNEYNPKYGFGSTEIFFSV